MTVRRKLIAMSAAVVAIQVVAGQVEIGFSAGAAEHQAASLVAHEQLEQLTHIEAGLIRELKEIGDLVVRSQTGTASVDVAELRGAQTLVEDSLDRHAALLEVLRAKGSEQSAQALRHEEELRLQLVAEISVLHAGVNDVAALLVNGPVDRDRVVFLDGGFERTIGWLRQLLVSERAEVAAQDSASAREAAWARTMGRATPVLSAVLLLIALTLVLRSISRPLSDLAEGATRVAGGDLEIAVPIRTGDELGQLARAFNDMQRSLKEGIAERDRALRDARFRSLSEAAPIAIAELDRDGRPVYVNRRWNELTGGIASPHGAWSDLVHEDDRPRAAALADGAAEEVRLLCGERTVWVAAQAAPLGEGSGRRILALADVTPQKEAIAHAEDMARELMTVSRKAGMAEISAGVLHNVGNVLNSIIVSATALKEQLRTARVANVVRAARMLEEHQGDLAEFLSTERGKLVPPYLIQAATQVAEDIAASSEDLGRIEKGTEHIRAIVATQQNYAKATPQTEELHLSDVIEDVLRMNLSSLERHEVRLVKRFEADPLLVTDRHKIMQILVNLISNARQALLETGDRPIEPRIEISTRLASSDHVAVEVADNGVGIPAENLSRVFEHGFTTRQTGHGFGLHSSALAAQELGGHIRVESLGVGRGASFILDLPVAAQEQAA